MKKRVSTLLVLALAGLVASCGTTNGDSSESVSQEESSSYTGNSQTTGSSETGASSSEAGTSSSEKTSETSESSKEEGSSSASSETNSSESSSSALDSSESSSSSNSEPASQAKVVSLNFGTSVFNNVASTTLVTKATVTSGGVSVTYSGDKVYQESSSTALKFASKSNPGVLTLSFNKSYKVTSVSINAFKYGSDNSTLTVEGSSYSQGIKVSSSSYDSSSFITYSNMNDETDTLTISAYKRCYVTSINIYIDGDGSETNPPDSSDPDTPSTPDKPSSGEEGYYSLSLKEVQDMSLASYPEYDVFGGDGLPTIGNPKLLVVPVYFAGDTAPSKAELDIVNTAFFGEEGETKFPSLSAYYKKSSYGNLNIGGVVTEAFQYSQSASAFQSSFEKSQKTTDDVLSEAITWAKSKGYLNNTFDTNGDGYYDGIDLIYFTDKDENDNEDLWWAYTTYVDEEGSASSPVPCRYFWSPMSMISNGYYTPDIDTHTLIHETGHMLGLDDYYSYDKTSNGSYKESPAAMVDMMDCNVGDHDAFSKMLMGWAAPKVVTGTGNFSITLSSFEETGEFLLIPASSYNNTVFDEYMILQYYTPTGLNALDSTGYPEWVDSGYYGHGGTYSSSGLQAFHVDARLWSVQHNDDTGRYSNVSYATDPSESEVEVSNNVYKINCGIAASNSGSYSLDVTKSKNASGTANTFSKALTYNSKNRLITALPASGSSRHLSSNFESAFGDNSTLYTLNGNSTYTNSKLGSCYQNSGKFNNGETFPYSFSVTAQTSDSITISFTSI